MWIVFPLFCSLFPPLLCPLGRSEIPTSGKVWLSSWIMSTGMSHRGPRRSAPLPIRHLGLRQGEVTTDEMSDQRGWVRRKYHIILIKGKEEQEFKAKMYYHRKNNTNASFLCGPVSGAKHFSCHSCRTIILLHWTSTYIRVVFTGVRVFCHGRWFHSLPKHARTEYFILPCVLPAELTLKESARTPEQIRVDMHTHTHTHTLRWLKCWQWCFVHRCACVHVWVFSSRWGRTGSRMRHLMCLCHTAETSCGKRRSSGLPFVGWRWRGTVLLLFPSLESRGKYFMVTFMWL